MDFESVNKRFIEMSISKLIQPYYGKHPIEIIGRHMLQKSCGTEGLCDAGYKNKLSMLMLNSNGDMTSPWLTPFSTVKSQTVH